ncbi:MAG: hypothetical protein D6776_02370 [Planctomycetota bacterium]|nr:MAG: hypothetical protein D6776_02370 [Planctomycetota bacterium]
MALYRRARAAPPPRRRALLESLVLRFPDHPLAVEAFHALLARSRPRPLVLATLKPIPLVRAPSAGESRAVADALEIGRLERIGAGSEPALAAFALYHAARLADRGGDAVRARALWERVAQLPVEGPIVQRARAALGAGSENAEQSAEPRR